MNNIGSKIKLIHIRNILSRGISDLHNKYKARIQYNNHIKLHLQKSYIQQILAKGITELYKRKYTKVKAMQRLNS